MFWSQELAPDTSQRATDQDCVSCKVIGTASLFGIGCYIIFATRPIGYYTTRPLTRQAIRFLSTVPFYASFARWFYLPPFDSIKPSKNTIYIMGVSGCGKSTVGSALASKLNRPFKDGDYFHSESNIEKMRAGVPLTDSDRLPWLKTINFFAISNPGHVIACSALKKSYRSVLCEHIPAMDQCGAVFILLNLKREVLHQRVTSRPGHFMPSSLLDSQLSTLEMPNQNEYNVVVIDANSENVDNIVNSIIDALKKFQ